MLINQIRILHTFYLGFVLLSIINDLLQLDVWNLVLK